MPPPTTPDRPAQTVPGDVRVPDLGGSADTGAGVPAGGPPPGTPIVPDDRRVRLIFSLVAGVLTLLCLGGVGIFISLYDNVTKIERTAPDAVVDQYLRAYLVNRDDNQAKYFVCKSPGDLSGVQALRKELAQREADFGVKTTVTWSSLTVTQDREGWRRVGTGLVIAGMLNGQIQSRRVDQWVFDVVDEDGWRVCGAAKVP